ncbi:MAG TPA: MEDS domain-containing protein, partial [Candidatus Acidoferrales bacterium]|nr:MEDS domain-containing protein [Candidatus Acidoferrales bacterium]
MKTTKSMASPLRPTGISFIGDLPWGAHFCHFYETRADMLDILVPYFKAGLENNEFCLWAISERISDDEVRNALRRAIPEAERHLTAGDIEIIPSSKWHLKNGAFDPCLPLKGWKKKLGQALARGYAGMRVSGDESWLTSKHWKNFLDYENMLNQTIADQRMIVLCTYPLELSKAAEVFDVAGAHEFSIARRCGSWEVLESPGLKQAKAEINKLNDELEQKVEERTKALSAANEGLRAEIGERKRTEAILDGQKRVLEMIAADAALPESLAALVRLIEAQFPGMLASILLIDEEGVHLRHGAAPNLPPEYIAAIDGGTIGPEAGSCGTAAYRR